MKKSKSLVKEDKSNKCLSCEDSELLRQENIEIKNDLICMEEKIENTINYIKSVEIVFQEYMEKHPKHIDQWIEQRIRKLESDYSILRGKHIDYWKKVIKKLDELF